MSMVAASPLFSALTAGVAAWIATAVGSSSVFLVKRMGERARDTLIGVATGIMLAVVYELICSARTCAQGRVPPVMVGFLAGCLLLYAVDRLLPHLHPGLGREDAEGIRTPWASRVLLVIAMTLHNVPEGLAIGVSFGAAGLNDATMTVGKATATTIGIGIQDIIEGLIVAIPLHQVGMSARRAFFWGQLSGLVEPIAAVAGAAAVLGVAAALSYALAFAAGAMFYVVFDELIPEIRRGPHSHPAAFGAVAGCLLMLALQMIMG